MFLKRFKNNLFIKKIQNYSLNYLKTPVKDKYEKLVEEHLEASFSYSSKGIYDKALKELKNAENIFYSNINQNNKLKIDLHNDFGMYFLEIGDYSNCENNLIIAKDVSNQILDNRNPLKAKIYNNLGLLYVNKGFYQRALEEYETALSIHKNNPLGDKPGHWYILNNFGVLYKRLNLIDKAYKYYFDALEYSLNNFGESSTQTATSFLNIGQLQANSNNDAEAIKNTENALKIFKKNLFENDGRIAIALGNLGFIYEKSGRLEEALKFKKESHKILETNFGSNHPNLSISFNNLGLIYDKLNQLDNAEIALKRSLEITENKLGDHPELSISINNLAGFYARRGLFDKAFNLYEKYVRVTSIVFQRELLYSPNNYRYDFFKSLIVNSWFKFSFSSNLAAEATMLWKINLHGILNTLERKQALISLNYSLLEKEISEIKNIINKLSSEDLNTENTELLNYQKEQLEKKIYRNIPEIQPEFIEINEITRLLNKDECLIEFLKFSPYDFQKDEYLEERYMAIIVMPNAQIETIDIGKANNIDEKISSVITLIKSLSETLISNNNRDFLLEDYWKDLSNILIRPLENFISNNKRIFFTLDSDLNSLPFTSLILPKRNKKLFDEKEICFLTKGSDLIRIYKNRKRPKKNNSLVVANPHFKNSNKKLKIKNNIRKLINIVYRGKRFESLFWESLPYSQIEGEKIAKILNADLLVKEKANKLKVKEINSPYILHIASHSFYESFGITSDNILLKSGIVLSDYDDKFKDIENDSVLTALEITKMDLSETEMVVISSCKSGLGKDIFGENILGIKSALSISGAKSTLLSIWEIDDAATAAFMESFYQRLKEGKSRNESLSQTQKDFKEKKIQSQNECDWSDVFYWGAFQLSGDWRSIKFDY